MSNTRPVHTDALATLGNVISDAEKRDAIHIAVEPVVAAVRLRAGDHVGLLEDGRASHDVEFDDLVGIVDPFLSRPVERGERFWLLLYPRQITSLRHVWDHPKFPPSGGGFNLMRPRSAGKAPRTQAFEDDDKPEPAEPVLVTEVVEAVALIDSEAYLSQKADDLDVSLDELIEAAKDYLVYGSYLSKPEYESRQGEIDETFWKHYEIFTGQTADEEERGTFLTCSCN